jgi:hypothetical protein
MGPSGIWLADNRGECGPAATVSQAAIPGPVSTVTIDHGTPVAVRPCCCLQPVVGTCGVTVQLSGLDKQISWPTAERTAPGLACVAAVGYSVRAWIDGKEKVYGSIP